MGDEGSALMFEAEVSDPGSDDCTFEWDFEYGPTITNTHYNDGANPDPHPSPWGTYPFSALDNVTYTYGDDYNYTLTLRVTIIEINIPSSVDEGLPVILQATAVDQGSDDLTFMWDFEYGPTIANIYHNDGGGPDPYPSPWGFSPFNATDSASHTYGDNGVYDVVLTIFDDEGGTTTYNTTVTVNNVAPIVDAIPTIVIDEGGTVVFEGHATDPGSDDLSFTWDWGYPGFGDTTNSYLNNPPNSDPYPSPELNPRDALDLANKTYGDNGVFTVTLTVGDDDGGEMVYVTNITVSNVNPNATLGTVLMDVEIGLRVAGRKYNEVGMTLFEDGSQVGSVSIERMPGSPDEQMAWIPVSIDFSKSYNAIVTYSPKDPPDIGGNPVWVYIKSMNGSVKKIHHTFNVQQSKKRDSDHWNHVEPWEVNISSHLIGCQFEVTSHVTDPGSDDLTLTYIYGSQVVTITYLNNPPIPDSFPSPEVNPRDIIDTTYLTYEGPGTLELVAVDDDGGTVSVSLELG
jgi:hypothetical protein